MKKSFKNIVNVIFVMFKASPIFFILNIFYIIFISFSSVFINYSIKLMTDLLISPNIKYNFLLFIIFALIFLLAIMFSANHFYMENYLRLSTEKNSTLYYKRKFINKVYNILHDKFLDSSFYSDLLIVKNNLNSTTNIVFVIVYRLLLTLFSFLVLVINLFIINSTILIIIFLFTPLCVIVYNFCTNKKIKLQQENIEEEKYDYYYNTVMRKRETAKEIRMNNSKSIIFNKWRINHKNLVIKRASLTNKINLLDLLVETTMKILEFIVIGYIIFLLINNSITIGDAVFIMMTSTSTIFTIIELIKIISNDLKINSYYINNFVSFIDDNNTNKNFNIEYNQIIPSTVEFKQLKIRNLSYIYPNSNNFAIRNLSFDINKGDIVAILGYNGSGKTTLSKILINSLKNYDGNIYLNDIDIKNLNELFYKSFFGVCFQDFNRFSLSLKENISIGYIEKFNDNISFKISNLDIDPNTILGKDYDVNGQELSGGEWQKIALARALFGDHEVIILDEPSASIDPIEEERILCEYQKIFKGRTLILISHRISFAKIADKILFMNDGEIVEQGSHDELISLENGLYSNFYNQQKELYNEG